VYFAVQKSVFIRVHPAFAACFGAASRGLIRQMKVLIINAHLNYPGWSEGRLNLTFMDAAKAFFTERGQPKPGVSTVAETFVERGYKPEDEVQKHVVADLIILQTPVNWFGAPWIYKKYHSHPTKDRQIGSPARCALTRRSRAPIPRELPVPSSRSSRARGRRGTRIR
jgi:hypothetical protein